MTRPCPGPAPISAPRLKAPGNACDSHMHILGPYDRFPLSEGRGYTAPEAPIEDFLALQDALGLKRAVIVHPSAYGTDMRVTEDAVARMGGRARGVAVVEPSISDGELDRLDEIGFRGLRFTTLLKGGADVGGIAAMAERVRRLGWHIQLFVDGANQIEALIPALRALPVDVVIDHMGHFPPSAGIGHPGFQALLAFMREGRCWTKLSGGYRVSEIPGTFADTTPFAQALIEARPDRVVWASDWPHVMLWDKPMPNTTDTLDWALSWGVGEATMARILVDNPAELYGF
ncbi:MAG: amidohydrolase family protein [Rhodospirillaceae bacterium]